MVKKTVKKAPKKLKSFGFGFVPEQNEHYFLVTVPDGRAKSAKVLISEHFEWKTLANGKDTIINMGSDDPQIKCILNRQAWEGIMEETKAEFNRRLRGFGVKVGNWPKKGQTPIDRTLGKELTLLAWAIEDADVSLVSVAIRNWLGLAPEERWWLYMMTNASTGHAIKDKGVGWRKAVRFALTENPVSDGILKKRTAEFESILTSRGQTSF
jgi:hypothetical protein